MGRSQIFLSILLCGTTKRLLDGKSFDIISLLMSQINNKQVELIYIIDNKKRTVGEKRNDLLKMAQGDYIMFIDDDDRISPDYVESLLKAIKSGADCIVFDVEISINGGAYKKVKYDAAYRKDVNYSDRYERIPNHIMCVKRQLALDAGFPKKQFGEDAIYARRLKQLIKTQARVKETLYYYDFSYTVSETQ